MDFSKNSLCPLNSNLTDLSNNKSGFIGSIILKTFATSESFNNYDITWTATENCFIKGLIYCNTGARSFHIYLDGTDVFNLWNNFQTGVSATWPVSLIPVKKGQIVNMTARDMACDVKAIASL